MFAAIKECYNHAAFAEVFRNYSRKQQVTISVKDSLQSYQKLTRS